MSIARTADLFAAASDGVLDVAPGAWLLRGFARQSGDALLEAVATVGCAAPFRHLQTPGGFRMSVATTNCGAWGWVSDRHGYRYSSTDPVSGLPWPAMPPAFRTLATAAAEVAAYPGFEPDACLINRYVPGAKMSLHQDMDELDFAWPIVSVSLGLPATFLFGGAVRAAKARRLPLEHGDVVVWGGPSRLAFHGVAPLKPGAGAASARFNLTFRRAH